MLASELVDYGIQTEDSDIRAHVSVVAGKVYVFPTKLAVALVKSGKYPERKAWQPGIPYPTAKGYIIPWRDIPNIVPVAASKFIREQNFGSEDSTTLKGEKASNVVEGLVRLGWFPLAVLPIVSEDTEIQRRGIDIIVHCTWRIQVKCDFHAGEGGTGNLFLQVAERNPFGAK